MKLSLSAYSYRDQLTGKDPSNALTLEELIVKCADWGLQGVELTSYYMPQPPTREYLLNLKRIAFLNGLAVTGLPIRTDFCQPPGEKRQEQVSHTLAWIERAAWLGAPCIRIFAGGDYKGDVAQQRQWCADSIMECLPTAASHGVILALENHGGIVPDAPNLLALADMIQSDWFGINLDTGNFRSDDPYRDIQTVAPRAVVAQVKTEIFQPDGTKVLADMDRVFTILRDAGYRGFVALEYEAAEPAPQAVPRELKRLQDVISRVSRGV